MSTDRRHGTANKPLKRTARQGWHNRGMAHPWSRALNANWLPPVTTSNTLSRVAAPARGELQRHKQDCPRSGLAFHKTMLHFQNPGRFHRGAGGSCFPWPLLRSQSFQRKPTRKRTDGGRTATHGHEVTRAPAKRQVQIAPRSIDNFPYEAGHGQNGLHPHRRAHMDPIGQFLRMGKSGSVQVTTAKGKCA